MLGKQKKYDKRAGRKTREKNCYKRRENSLNMSGYVFRIKIDRTEREAVV